MPELYGKAMIEVRGLRKSFDGAIAVDRLDLAVLEGEVFALVGPEGAGKTTTIRILCGELAPSEGSARVAGFDAVSQPEQVRPHIGYVPARLSLYGDLTVDENLLLRARERAVDPKSFTKRRERLLSLGRLGRFRRRLARDLPRGMRQRLALACALIHAPEVLLLDEPTAGLEPLAQDEFWELLLDLVGPKAEQRSTALLSSANIAEADRCRRVGMMCQGRLLACGTPWEIRRELGLEMLEVECESVEQAQAVLCKRPGVKWAELSGKRLQVALAGQESGQEVRRALQEHGLEVRSLRRIEPSLKHAYHELIWRARQS